MSRRAFDTELTLDLAVNAIPLAIVLFFTAAFALFNPWGFEPLESGIQFAILLSVAVTLAAVTFLAARVIESDPRTHHDTVSSIHVQGGTEPTDDDGTEGPDSE
ncbi:DUF6684 family protein [Halosolutus gelatinilyticus]|uniref:DUF6684 family protein n=1 Tax=Halosolutus gelatinilyticus TaxID=2931975 RepID=UPI001FF4FEEE|nr:DUF6684 family protein [Halosolutus gelatinilyticus]